VLNALTIDVEEHFQAHAFAAAVPRSTWDAQESRVVASTRRVLDVLAAEGAHATFFVLGWVADRHPGLVRDIVAAGHEVGSHGYAHELVYRQTREDFADDLARASDAIRRALGAAANGDAGDVLLGYRAPAFSVTDDAGWALEVVRAQGFRYDSSVVPVMARDGAVNAALRGGKRRGLAGVGRFAARHATGLLEIPPSTVALAGRNWPVAGGGYLRLLPLFVTRGAIRRINAEGHPAVVYLHPWEVDPGQPPVPGVPALARFRHGVNLHRTEVRLRRLLKTFRFGAMRDVFADQLRS
jgi:polysaccharide deacetylase family protein (PEP-CTERM system associated)